jgi:hypothetical protein
MPVPLKIQLVGVNELADMLRGLESKYFKPAARAGISDAGAVVLTETRNRVPERTGSLKKALGRKVVALKGGAGYTAVVGARKDASGKKLERLKAQVAAGKRKKLPREGRFRRTVTFQGREILVNPVKYLHLIEYGRRAVTLKTKKVLADGAVIYGKTVAAVPASGFMRAAWAASKDRGRAKLLDRMKAARAKAVANKGR